MTVNRTSGEHMRLDGYLSRFHLSKFSPSTDCAGVYQHTVEYVHTIIDMAISTGSVKPVGMIIFNLPDTWQWVPPPNDCPGPLRMPGQWVHVAGKQGGDEVERVSAAPLAHANSGSGIAELKPQPSVLKNLPPAPSQEVRGLLQFQLQPETPLL